MRSKINAHYLVGLVNISCGQLWKKAQTKP